MALIETDLGQASVVVPRQPKEMITVRVDEKTGKTLVKINSSSLSVIQECPRKAKYLLHEGWKSATESPATLFGSAVHKALEVFYAAPPQERKLIPLEDVELAVLGINKSDNLIAAAARAFGEKAGPLAQLPDTDKRSLVNGAWILHHYFKAYIDDPYQVLVDEHGPFVERGFSFKLYEDPTLIVEYFGTIDAVKQHVVNKNILCVDYKTTSQLGGYGDNASYFEKDKPNAQYTGYLLGLREALGIDVNEFCVDVIEVKARPKTARGSAPSFPRQITTRDADDYAEFKESVLKAVRDYLYFQGTNSWPLGPVSSCNLWGACTYKQVCASPKSVRENILKGKFNRG